MLLTSRKILIYSPIEIRAYQCTPPSATEGGIEHVWNERGLHINGGEVVYQCVWDRHFGGGGE